MDLFTTGFALFFAAQLIRALPWPEWMRARKPLSCNACMAGWSGIAAGIAGMGPPTHLLGAAGVAYLLMGLTDSWLARSWPMPPSE